VKFVATKGENQSSIYLDGSVREAMEGFTLNQQIGRERWGRCTDLVPASTNWKSRENHRENDRQEEQQQGQEPVERFKLANSRSGPAGGSYQIQHADLFNS
jgi:hypothetical protein